MSKSLDFWLSKFIEGFKYLLDLGEKTPSLCWIELKQIIIIVIIIVISHLLWGNSEIFLFSSNRDCNCDVKLQQLKSWH